MASPARAAFNQIQFPVKSYTGATNLIPITDPDTTPEPTLTDGFQTLTFAPVPTVVTVPTTWATWNSPPFTETSTPRGVRLAVGQTSIVITLSVPSNTFGVEWEPDPFAIEPITAVFKNGATVLGTIVSFPNGDHGGLLGAASDTVPITEVDITSTTDFALANFRYGSVVLPAFFDPGPFFLSYAANLTIADSFINVTNAGTKGGFDAGDIFGRPAGGICVNAYYFDPNEELLTCCSCYVSPNALHSFSLQQDFLAKLLTPGTESAGTVMLISTDGATGTCTNSAATWTLPELGMRAWMTTSHNNTSIGTTSYQVTENAFQGVSLAFSEQQRIQQICGTIITNGSNHGICNSCPSSGLAAAKQ